MYFSYPVSNILKNDQNVLFVYLFILREHCSALSDGGEGDWTWDLRASGLNESIASVLSTPTLSLLFYDFLKTVFQRNGLSSGTLNGILESYGILRKS